LRGGAWSDFTRREYIGWSKRIYVDALNVCLLQQPSSFAYFRPAPDTIRSAGACEWCAKEVHQKEIDFEQDFLRRSNGLAAALSDFAHTYNSRGVVDVKKVKAIRKALRDLESQIGSIKRTDIANRDSDRLGCVRAANRPSPKNQ
jgi:hypothetical protein